MESSKEEVKKVEAEVKALPLRQIIIETNGKDVRLVKAEVAGTIELTAILQLIISFINKEVAPEAPKEEVKA